LVAAILGLIVAALYWRSLDYPLQFDDIGFFSSEGHLQALAASAFEFQRRWFSYATFGWTYELFGHRPAAYRLGNIAIHALTALALYAFLARLFGIVLSKNGDSTLPYEPKVRWLALFSALIFALHPVAVYANVYIVQRSVLMATLFSIIALGLYTAGLLRQRKGPLLWSVAFYFLAVFSREHSVTLPGVALALTFLVCRPSRELLKLLWMPYAGYLLIALFIAVRVQDVLYEPFADQLLSNLQGRSGTASTASESLGPAEPVGTSAGSLALSAISQGYLFFKYLGLWLLPNPAWMSIDIRQPFARDFLTWPHTAGFVAFLAYPIVAARLLLHRGSTGLLGFGLLAPWVLFLTELSSIRIQEQFVLYRSYLWMWPLLAAVPWGSEHISRRWRGAAGIAACVLLIPLTMNRINTFSSEFALWDDVARKNTDLSLPGAERGYINRGSAYLQTGRLQLALDDYNKAIQANPRYAVSYVDRGAVYSAIGRYKEAAADFEQAISLSPNLSSAYVNRGLNYFRVARIPEALTDFNHAIKLDSRNASAYANRGLTYLRMGRLELAKADFTQAIALNPTNADDYNTRGVIHFRLGELERALEDLKRALELNPALASAHFNRGLVYLNTGRPGEAQSEFTQALRLRPTYATAYMYRSMALMKQSQPDTAMQDLDRAIATDPQLAQAYALRADLHRSGGRLREARTDYDHALRLNPMQPAALKGRAEVLAALGLQKEAAADLTTSCKLGDQAACSRIK